MSHMNKRTVRKMVCTSCNITPVKYFGATCRSCFDKPFIEADARAAEHNARLKAEHDRKWAEYWESTRNNAKNNNRLPAVPSSMSETRLANYIAAPVGVWLAFEGHEFGWFLVLGSLAMTASDWWDRRYIRANERKIKELKRKLQ